MQCLWDCFRLFITLQIIFKKYLPQFTATDWTVLGLSYTNEMSVVSLKWNERKECHHIRVCLYSTCAHVNTHCVLQQFSLYLHRFSVGESCVSGTLSYAATRWLKNLMAASQQHRRTSAQYPIAQDMLCDSKRGGNIGEEKERRVNLFMLWGGMYLLNMTSQVCRHSCECVLSCSCSSVF